MFLFFQKCGLYGWPLLAITITNLVLVILTIMKLAGDRPGNGSGLHHRVNSILFWGMIAAVTGLLGQYHGIYKGLNAIISATAISPPLIAQGFAESFTTTLWGLTVFVISAVLWLILSNQARRWESRAS